MEITKEKKIDIFLYENEKAQELYKANQHLYNEGWSSKRVRKFVDKQLEELLKNDKVYQKAIKEQEENKKQMEELKAVKELEDKEKLNNRIKELKEAREKGEQVIIYVDGARNNWGGKYGITDIDGREIEKGNNRQISEQIEIEAYAILKGVSWAKDQGDIKSLKIMTDCQVLSYGEDFKSKTQAGKYFWLARKIAKESNIELEFEWVSGKENKADYLTRN